jgi:hypothetical protein
MACTSTKQCPACDPPDQKFCQEGGCGCMPPNGGTPSSGGGGGGGGKGGSTRCSAYDECTSFACSLKNEKPYCDSLTGQCVCKKPQSPSHQKKSPSPAPAPAPAPGPPPSPSLVPAPSSGLSENWIIFIIASSAVLVFLIGLVVVIRYNTNMRRTALQKRMNVVL